METTTKARETVPSTRGLTAADFTRIAANGFGDPQNAYCHAMAYFQGHVYVGTTRHSMALLKLFPPAEPPVMNPWPVQAPARVEDLDMRGQIWRWSVSEEQWERVFTAPVIVGKNGQEVPRDLGYRGMAVFQGRSDAAPALYVSTMSTVLRGTAAHILRSEDGVSFSPVSEPGLGNPDISTFRSLVAFDGHLYVPPTGEGIQFNSNRASVIMRSADPLTAAWEIACEPGFGDSTNQGIFELTVFNDYLYAGTFNYLHGYQVWKTPATGAARNRWTKVIERGAYRGQVSEIAMSMCAFDGALYVGSAIQNGGFDRTNRVGPEAGEIIRIYPDDSWDLLVGTPRLTPDGMKYPLSGMGPGFDNIFAGYIWRMAVHEGWLYASTFDWSVFLSYAGRPSPAAKQIMQRIGVGRVIRQGGGFDVWRTQDGSHWIPVSRNGLGNPYNYGARTLVSTPHGLFLGTANPFGPEVAAKLSTGWVYIPNPHGGAEVWLGRASDQAVEPQSTSDGKGVVQALMPERDGAGGRSVALFHVIGSPSQGRGSPRILLTGATGFIGAHLLERLLPEGQLRVLALEETVKHIRYPDRIAIVIGDITEEESLIEAVRGIDVVYHLAALLPGSSYADLMRVNVHGTENLLRACVRAGDLRRFVFLSSVAVYGGPFIRRNWPYTETSPLRPGGSEDLRNYGHSKVAAERLVQRHAKDFGFDYVILRAATCYGIGGKFLQDLIRRVLTDPGAGYGRGGALAMQLIHVRDLGEVMVQAGLHSGVKNEVFNIAGAEAPIYRHVAKLIRLLARAGDGRALVPDPSSRWQQYDIPYEIDKARSILGFVPRVSLQEGLLELVIRQHDQHPSVYAPPTSESYPPWKTL